MRIPIAFLVGLPAFAEPSLTYDNHPTGSETRPLVLRTYLPDPGLDAAVFSQHDQGRKVSKYNPGTGRDVDGEIQPIPGIAAAVAVNFGPSLSYTFDTTECRFLYAWQGGFLDMTPYWGDTRKGSRISFDYVPRLIGTLFHKTSGRHPIEIDGKSLSDLGPRVYQGYHLNEGVPVFEYRVGEHEITFSARPAPDALSFHAHITCSAGPQLGYRGIERTTNDGSLKFTLTGTALATFQGYQRNEKIVKATAAAGESLFGIYGCAACHSTDGSAGHGPSLAGVAGHLVEIEGLEQPVTADHAYLLESIKDPNTKVVKGFPPNYMPPYGLPDAEYESLILYIQSLAAPEKSTDPR